MSYDVRLILSRIENSYEIRELLKEPNSVDLSDNVVNNDLKVDELSEVRLMVIPKLVDGLKRICAHFQLKLKAKLHITEDNIHFIIRAIEVPSADYLKITYHHEDITEEHDFKSLIEKLKYKCYSNGDYLAMHIQNSIREFQLVELNNPKYLLTVYDLDLAKFDNKNSTVVILPFIISRDVQTRTRLMEEYASRASTPRIIFVVVGYDYKDINTKELIESVDKYFQFFKIDYRESQDIITVDDEYRYRSKIVYSDDNYIVEDLFKANSVVHRRLFFKQNFKYVQTEMVFFKGEEIPEEKGSEVFGIFCDGIQESQNTIKKVKGSNLNVTILGSGCGSLSKYTTSRLKNIGLNCSIKGVEIDEEVMAIGTKFFNMNKDSNCQYKKADAYEYMLSNTNNFDIVLLDIDDKVNCPPSQFFSDEFVDAVARSLQSTNFGYFGINTLDIANENFDHVMDILRKKFESVKVVNCINQNNKVILCQKLVA